MKSVKFSGALSLVAIAVSTTLMTQSVIAADSGWYSGVNLGHSRARVAEAKISSNLLGAGLTMTSINEDSRDTGYKLFGGYQFNEYFALEGGYFDLSKFGYTATTLPVGTLRGDIKLRGINLDVMGILPLSKKFSAFGRVGLNYAEARDSFIGSGAVNVLNVYPRKRDTNIKFGLGVQYDFTQALGLRVEAERYRINDAVGSKGDIDLISLGLIYRFGGKTPARVQAPAQAPAMPARYETDPVVTYTAPIVAYPTPKTARSVTENPTQVIVPIAVRTEQYCGILDFQFEINQDEIQREEWEKLAAVGVFLNRYPDSTALIEGHTDNVGAPEHNMALSQRRADNVVRYLIENSNISPARLTAVGYGDTRPLADNDSEAGKRMNRRIDAVIACVTDAIGLTVIPARLTMAMEIEFDQNSADLNPQYDGELYKVANYLKTYPTVTATVEGHTGNLQTTPELAMQISQQRAQNVVNALVNRYGIARKRLTAEGFGERRRVAYNTSLEGQQENRRVNIIFNYAK